MPKKAAVMIDSWKLPIFKRILDEAGYVYEKHPGLTKDMINLTVEYDFISNLKPYIDEAQIECKRRKKWLKKNT